MQLTSQPFLAEEERQEGWSIVQTPEVLSPCIAVVPIPPSLPPSVPLRSSFLLCRPGPINSQLIAEWHFSSSGTYTAAPPQWKWNHTAAAAAGKGRNGDGNGTSERQPRPGGGRLPLRAAAAVNRSQKATTIKGAKEATTD